MQRTPITGTEIRFRGLIAAPKRSPPLNPAPPILTRARCRRQRARRCDGCGTIERHVRDEFRPRWHREVAADRATPILLERTLNVRNRQNVRSLLLFQLSCKEKVVGRPPRANRTPVDFNNPRLLSATLLGCLYSKYRARYTPPFCRITPRHGVLHHIVKIAQLFYQVP